MILKRGRGGSVLLYVLITSLIVGMIAAYLMRMFLDRYTAVQRQADSTSGRLSNESSLAVLISNPLKPCMNYNLLNGDSCACSGRSCGSGSPAGQAQCTLTCTNPNKTNSSKPVIISITPGGSGSATAATTP